MADVFKNDNNYKNLDYLACWIMKAARYIDDKSEAAFVCTTSIFQGSQVGMLWPKVFNYDVHISFAYNFFKWSNVAKGVAGVYCTVIGLSSDKSKIRRIYKDGFCREVENIGPYVVESGEIIVESQKKSISRLPLMIGGNQPREGGFLTLSDSEKKLLLQNYPAAQKFIKPLMGTNELLKSIPRWCIWIKDEDVEEAQRIPEIRARIEKVREKRVNGNTVEVNFASMPYRFVQTNKSENHQIVIPNVSTSKRNYIPIGYESPDFIITNLAMMIPNADLTTFAIVSSRMHWDWVKAVSGRLGDGVRYTVGLCFNTFPVPEMSDIYREELKRLAEEVLLAREDYPDKNLDFLYNPKSMPEPLLQAHRELDNAVDKLYREKPFRDSSDRLEHLFARYEKLIAEEKANSPAKQKAKGSK